MKTRSGAVRLAKLRLSQEEMLPPNQGKDRIRLAYLVSNHPIISQAFVVREIEALRREGFEIEVVSIGRPDRGAGEMSTVEREEMARTFYVKDAGLPGVVRAHLRLLAAHPGGYLRALREAIRIGGSGLAEQARHLAYFAQAGVIARRLEQQGLRHFHAQFVSPAGLLAARIGRAGMSMRVHGSDEFYDATRYRVAEKVAASEFVCAVSGFTASQLMRLTPPPEWEKFEVAPIGVNVREFSPGPFRPDPNPFEILLVARLIPAKGHRQLIAAAQALVEAGRDLRLRLVGDGPDRPALEALTSRGALGGRVIFEGAVNQDRIRAIYRQADLFVLPSFAEGVPAVLMEAMAMEIACISTKTGAVFELIRDGEDGLLVRPGDSGELAAAIRRMMDDAALRRRLAEAGRRRVEEAFDLDKNTKRLAGIFRRRLLDKIL